MAPRPSLKVVGSSQEDMFRHTGPIGCNDLMVISAEAILMSGWRQPCEYLDIMVVIPDMFILRFGMHRANYDAGIFGRG